MVRPRRMLRVVVLPEPLGPSRPKIRPRGTSIDSPSTATIEPYLLVRPWVRITESLIRQALSAPAQQEVQYSLQGVAALPYTLQPSLAATNTRAGRGMPPRHLLVSELPLFHRALSDGCAFCWRRIEHKPLVAVLCNLVAPFAICTHAAGVGHEDSGLARYVCAEVPRVGLHI